MRQIDLRPMLATLVDAPFDDKAWVFEIKWDGYRIVADCRRARVILYSRNGLDVTGNYPSIAKALERVAGKAVIDGELVALDERGRSRFQLLQNARRNGGAPLRFYAFDLLFLNGKDLRGEDLLTRKLALRKILPRSALVKYSEHIEAHGKRLFAEAKRQRLEGIMAKRIASRYDSGRRTRDWLKIKAARQQEAIIVGFTAPRGSRQFFGSIVLGVYAKGELVYAGNAGTGFDHETLRSLHQKMLKLKTNVKPVPARTKSDRETTWIRPVLVCEIRFTEWTASGEMRHPSFLGLRNDKRAKEVVREMP